MSQVDALLSNDDGIRKQALDIEKSFIIQAPAGSGKTELLIQRYLKLLACVTQPEEIVAITFTVKAANEMKQRVLRAITKASSNIKPTEDYQIKTHHYANEVLKKDKECKWNLIHAHKRMKILTLDSLCSEIVNKSPVTSKFGFGKKLLLNRDLKANYRLAAISTLNLLSNENAETSISDAEKLLMHIDVNLYKYIDYVEKMLARRDQWMDIIGSGVSLNEANYSALRVQLEKNIQSLVADHQSKLIQEFPEQLFLRLSNIFNFLLVENDKFTFLSSLSSVKELNSYEHNDSWCLIADLLLTKSGAWRKSLNKNNGFPPAAKEEKEETKEIINEASDLNLLRELLHSVRLLPNPHYDAQQWDILIVLFRLLPYAVAELKNIFAQKNTADFIEMADCARLALGDDEFPTDLALIMDYKLKHILVDEMQDTSTRQYQFLESLTRGWEEKDKRTLFLVGDPMQSIFRFRNAQVSQFLISSKKGLGDIPLTFLVLKSNYRSGGILVDQFNQTFKKVLPSSEDLVRGAVTYSEATADPSKINSGEYSIHSLFDKSKEAQAAYTVNIIRNKLKQTAGNIAILVRSRPQLTLLLTLLREEKIHYNAVEIDRLTDLPEVIDLLALTRAICHKCDRAAWLGILRGPLLGLTWIDLIALVRGENEKSIWELIQDKSKIKVLSKNSQSRLNKFCHIISPYVDPSKMLTLRERVEITWYRLNGPALITNIEQLENIQRFFKAIEAIDVGGSLDDPSELESKIDEIRVTSSDLKEVRINVMTIHKSKGLEFDHVILPSLGAGARASERPVINWMSRPSDSFSDDIVISPIGSRDEDKLHSYIQETSKEGELLELDRLIYVAYTRARESLEVIGNVKTKQTDDGNTLIPPSKSSLLGRLWPSLRKTFETNLENENISSDNYIKPKSIYTQPILRRINDLYLTPFASKAPSIESFGLDAESITSDNIEYSWVGENAKKSGTIIHRWLYKLSVDKKIPSLNEVDSFKPMLINWARNIYVKEDQLDNVMKKVYQAMTNVIEDKKNHQIILSEGFSELPLTGVWENKHYSIIIDRVHIDENNQHWIIDYKTGNHEGGRLSDFIDSEAIRYKDQLTKYAAIYKNYSGLHPKTALYFPNLKILHLTES
tara:strand:- start:16839 stop:20222 length:3384 start_codon:yes stop_codon:yes gene_type:complete